MPRFRTAYASVIVLALICSSVVPARAGEPGFRVSSYVPDKFQDFQWLVSGGAGMTGACDTRVTKRADPSDHYTTDARHEYSSYQIGASTGVLYRLQTVPRAVEFSASFSGEAAENDGDRSSDLRLLPDYGSHSLRQSTNRDYLASVETALEASQYVAYDLFFRFSGAIDLNFEETSAFEENFSSQFHIDSADGSTVERLDNSLSESATTSKNHFLEGELMVGWGRLHEGQYGATALFIIESLRRAGFLIRPPDYVQMQRLARLVHTGRRAFLTDERIHRITSLNGIITYLTEIGAIDDPGPYGHLLVQDVWDYYPAYRRSFGWRLLAGIGGKQRRFSAGEKESSSNGTILTRSDSMGVLIDTTEIQETSSEYSDYDHNVTHTDYLLVLIEYHLPVDLHWQLSVSGYARKWLSRPSETNNSLYSVDLSRENYDWGLGCELRYIFDARTDMLASVDLTHDYLLDDRLWTYHDGPLPGYSIEEFDKKSTWHVVLDGKLTYRISIPTTLSVELGVIWERGSRSTNRSNVVDDKFSYALNTTLAHYLF